MDSTNLAWAIVGAILIDLGENADIEIREVQHCLSVYANGGVLVYLNIRQRHVSVDRPTKSKEHNSSCKQIAKVEKVRHIPIFLGRIKKLYLERYPQS